MQVRDLMNPSVVSITPSESAALAARLLSRHNVGSLPVCGEDGGLRGIVTDRGEAGSQGGSIGAGLQNVCYVIALIAVNLAIM